LNENPADNVLRAAFAGNDPAAVDLLWDRYTKDLLPFVPIANPGDAWHPRLSHHHNIPLMHSIFHQGQYNNLRRGLGLMNMNFFVRRKQL